MQKKTGLVAAFYSVFSAYTMSAQENNPCAGFPKKHCMDTSAVKAHDDTYFYNAQSKGGLFTRGMTSTMRCVVYKGMEYRVTLCMQTDALGDSLHVVISDARSKEILFDNAKEAFVNQIEFTVANTRQLLIEISVPEGNSAKSPVSACIGVLIEHRRHEVSGGFGAY